MQILGTERRIFRKLRTKSRKKRVMMMFFFAVIFFFTFLIKKALESEIVPSLRSIKVTFESYDGEEIAVYNNLMKDHVSVDELPDYVRQAIVLSEDPHFYDRSGIVIFWLPEKIQTEMSGRESADEFAQNDSLLMRLAKDLFPFRDNSLKRKIQEVVLAFRLEKKYSKKQILSMYINRAYFGSYAYGIEAASRRYFGKNAKQLTLYEAVKLIGALKNPRRYSLLYNRERSDERAEAVLSSMLEANFISETEMREALLEKDKISIANTHDENNTRYFTEWLFEQLNELITLSSLSSGDILVRTTLDSKLQKTASRMIEKFASEESTSKYRANHMAMVSIDKTGAIRAMVDGNRVIKMGSLLDYIIYLTVLEKEEISLCDMISDEPVTVGEWSHKDNDYKSSGEISVLDAFVKSIDVCSVRMAQHAGMDSIAKKAKQLGISASISKDISCALGTTKVSLMEMTSAYGASMNDGKRITPFGIISIINVDGKELYRAYHHDQPKAMSSESVTRTKVMLQESGKHKDIISHIDCFGKACVSSDRRDTSFIGFSGPLVTGIWIGNDDSTMMDPSATTASLPRTMWHEYMLEAFSGYEQESSQSKLDSDIENKMTANKSNSNKRTLERKRIRDLLPVGSNSSAE